MSRDIKTSAANNKFLKQKKILYIDFDGTITKKDVLNYLLEKHASKDWLSLDKLYLDGKISSSACIKKQVNLLKNISTKQLLSTAEDIDIDDNFVNLLDLCKKNKIKVEILSDGLDIYIKHLLKKNGIDPKKIKIRCNMFIENGIVHYPYKKKLCTVACANCKAIHLNKKYFKIYIGDGKSDECVAQKSNLIFAKGHLSEYLSKKKHNYIYFNNFNDIIKKLRTLI
jgi:2,3-diketo-5-methylthio-1-phosphopentane phosphatase